ncbi:serine/threonine-protein phosphatase [Streptomyces sp. N2-109]|uniref:Serine/threonine-protein phosphatase n=1 Tax=Streptomyces gossypii TaxID=2883101 RepID=A0ABT2JP59_9ACTN|nr:PP2C family protein-serine/threonine phosphatase [Streptomyces gossypii]MCT2589667.1 serine/threonine-protein phosphatase [Streptomyces gossypii]
MRQHERLWAAVPWLLIAAIPVVEVIRRSLEVDEIRVISLLVAAPATAAIRGRPRSVLAVSIAAFVVALGNLEVDSGSDMDHRLTALGAVMLMSVVSMWASVGRARSAAQLSQVRRVAEAAQLALLRPMPRRVGELRMAARYLAAESEARIGGDLYEAGEGPHGTRLIIGDVRGKGLPAVLTAGAVLGAFREAARYERELTRIAVRCSQAVSLLVRSSIEEEARREEGARAKSPEVGGEDAEDFADADGPWAEWGAMVGQAVPDAVELFVTAILVEFDGPVLRMVNLGHPPPLLLTDRTAEYVEVKEPLPPLGLADLFPDDFSVHTQQWRRGDRLLLYTDGITEARNSDGEFFPLQPCANDLLRVRTAALPDELLREVGRHTGGELEDDAAIVTVEWSGERAPADGARGTTSGRGA